MDIRSDWRAGEYSRESCQRERREDRTDSGISDQTGEQVSIAERCHGERREDRTDSRISDQTGEQVSIAERVAMERGEKIGQTVGYQIRLESR